MPTDRWNIKKIYPDSFKNPMSYYIGPLLDNRVDTEGGNNINLARDGDVYYYASGNDFGNYNITTTSGYDAAKIITNHTECDALGFMQDIRDWKNTETTIYVQCVSSSQGRISIKSRGGKHNGVTNCEGFGYIANIYTDGSLTFAKEQYHNLKLETDEVQAIGNFEDQWLGIKFCIYNQDTSVILEIYLDVNGQGNWMKAYSFVDAGGWGSLGLICNATREDAIGTWGGPIVALRWENFDIFNFKWISVREIDPYIPFNEGGSSASELYGYGALGATGSASILRI